MEREIDRRIGAASAVMQSLYRSVVVKKELSQKAKLSIYRSIYVPTLTYGHELWVMTERTRSWIQAAEMSFLHRVAGRTLRDRVRSAVTREELGVEPLLLHIERSQLRWLGHLGGGPEEDPGHVGETMSLDWPGNVLVFHPRSLLRCLGRGRFGFPCSDCYEEFQGLLRQSSTTSTLPPQPVSLPLRDMNQLEAAEETLKTDEAKKIMVSRFAVIGGTSVEVRVRRMLSCALTNELSSKLNWAGKKAKHPGKQKYAFKDTVLKACMFEALKQQVGEESASEYAFAVAVQKWLRYAPDHVGETGRQSAAPTDLQQ
ncbi:uncharacterized protein LOC143525918 [Brachyhypopomus gauderio]|uniref:uncharacterized protein LOC143525918 n=1 Tax=Brachyhypopomus gauderio TaxID=698409 RepID=UPI004041EAAC